MKEPRDCEHCPWSQYDDTGSKLAGHMQLRHPDLASPPLTEPAQPLEQLPKVAFFHAFAAAVRDLPIGWHGTTADLHALVAPPLDHHWWGSATTHVQHLGLLAKVKAQRSSLETTNGSLVYEWERVVIGRRAS